MEIKTMDITPDMAKRWLNHPLSERNRKIQPGRVAEYANIMKRGEWGVVSDSVIGISEEGAVVNGRHRLSAIVGCGLTIRSLVCLQETFANQVKIDGGQRRIGGQQLQIEGCPNANIVAAALGWINRYKYGFSTARLTNQQIINAWKSHPQIVESAKKIGGVVNILQPSIATFCHYIFAEISPEAADVFFDRLSGGAGLEAGSAILLLRNRLIKEISAKKKTSKKERAALAIKAWNAYRSGIKLKNLRWRTDKDANPESFPVAI